MQKIKIKFVNDGRSGPYFPYEFEVSNGIVTINFEINGDDNFREFGEKLKGFPLVQFSNTKDFSAIYRYGTKSRDYRYRFSLDVSIWKTNGHPLISIKFESLAGDKAEFSIRTVPYSIITLGKMLSDWHPREESDLIWVAE
jgi:hypothetical protein